MKSYDANKPADVREFSNKIARLMNSGPAGAISAKRILDEQSKSASGRALISKMRHRTRILAEAPGVSLKNVEVRKGSAASEAAKQLGAEAFAGGDKVAFRHDGGALHLVAHEVAHVVQQSKRD